MNNILFSLSPEHQFVQPNYENIEEYCDEPIVHHSIKKKRQKKKSSKDVDSTIVNKSHKSKKIIREGNKKKYEEFMDVVKENNPFKDRVKLEEENKLKEEDIFKLPDVSDILLIYEPKYKSAENIGLEVSCQEKPENSHKKNNDLTLPDNDNKTQIATSIKNSKQEDIDFIKFNNSLSFNIDYYTLPTNDENITDNAMQYPTEVIKTLELPKEKEKLKETRQSIFLLNSSNLTQETIVKRNGVLEEAPELQKTNKQMFLKEPKIEKYASSDDEGLLQFVTIERRNITTDNKIFNKLGNERKQNNKFSFISHRKPRRKVPVRCIKSIDNDICDGTDYFEQSTRFDSKTENEIKNKEALGNNHSLSLLTERKSVEEQNYFDSSKSELIEVEKDNIMGISRYFLDHSQENVIPSVITINNMLKIMGQKKISSFRNLFPLKIRKIGEGSFGEVYSAKNSINQDIIYKVTPFEPNTERNIVVNGDTLKGCRELIVEYIITNEMSKLYETSTFSCSNFVKLYKGIIVKGIYPKILIDAWKSYEKNNNIFNENPSKYKDKVNYYMVLELEDAGIELEKYNKLEKSQAYSIIFQLIHCLRIAENVFQFEHRDLHDSNILIQEVNEKTNIEYIFGSTKYKLKSFGVKVKIIDYTLSRMSLRNEEYYLNLEQITGLFDDNFNPDTFQSIYLKMRKLTKGDWSKFCPKNNLLWIIYHVKRLFSFENVKDQEFIDFFTNDVSKMQCLEELVNDNKFIKFQENFII